MPAVKGLRVRKRTGLGLALGAVALGVTVAGTGVASAASTTVVVQEHNVSRQAENTPPAKNWVIYTRNAGTATFRSGPATPPLGVGSLELNTPTGSDKVQAFNYDHIGTALSAINALGYSTYRSAGQLQQDTALNIEIDYNGPNVAGGFTTLVFEPVYNTDQGAVVNGQWQTWDAYNNANAVWWSTKDIPGVCAFTCYVTWNNIVAANPDATVLGGFGLNQGSGNPALTVANDALTFGAGSDKVIYNFEPELTPTNKDQCKNGGWATFNYPTFKNQGDCVSYTNNGK